MDENPAPESKSLSPVVGFAAASALGAILIIILAHQFGLTGGNGIIRQIARSYPAYRMPAVPPPVPVTGAQLVPVVPPLPTHLPPADAALAAMVAQGVSALGPEAQNSGYA